MQNPNESNGTVVADDENTGVEFVDVSAAGDEEQTATDGTIDRTNAAEAQSSEKFVPFNKLNADRDRNPRRKDRYTVGEIGWLARSIYERGLLKPLVVSLRADGSYWILEGHLRHGAIQIVRTDGLPAVKGKEGKEAVPADPKFMDKVKCRVVTGLSLIDEIDLVMDHGTTTPLDRREQYVAGRKLRKMGFSQNATADRLGIDRSVFSKKDWVAVMPPCVEEMYMADPDLDTTIALPDTVIGELYKAYNEDKAEAKKLKLSFRPGTAGKAFTAKWEAVLKGGGKKAKSINAVKLLKIAEQYRDQDIQDVLMAIAEGNEQKLGAAITRVEIRMVPLTDLNVGGTVVEEGIAHTVQHTGRRDES